MIVYVFVLLSVIVMFSFDCFAPVTRLAVKIVSKITYSVTSMTTELNSGKDGGGLGSNSMTG